MKHRLFAVTAAVSVALCFSFGLSACKTETPPDPTPEHEHTFGDWMMDETTHWRECTECHEKLVESAHSFDNITGAGYPAYTGTASENLPLLKATAPEGKSGAIYVKEVWACLTPKEGADLQVAYSTGPKGTFANHVDLSADEGGWTKAAFAGDGLLLSTYSYFRLQAIGGDFTVREIVLLGSDAEGKEAYFLLKLENTGDSNKGQEGERRKGLIDEQQFPNEKRECTVCGYSQPKTV